MTEEREAYASGMPPESYPCDSCGQPIPADSAYAPMETLIVLCRGCLLSNLRACEGCGKPILASAYQHLSSGRLLCEPCVIGQAASLNPPVDMTLPFFAYGLFRPGELGFLALKSYVSGTAECQIAGSLLERDGLPIADETGPGFIWGYLLSFDPSNAAEAYRSISSLEPGHQYRWSQVNLSEGRANVLWGRSPRKGSVLLDTGEWEGRDDPLLTTGLEVVRETLAAYTSSLTFHSLFYLQMAYLLLWSSIERYASLRYHLGGEVYRKVRRIADEPAFAQGLRKHVMTNREVFRADSPDVKEILDPRRPEKSLGYYYQIRSNIIHRGKAVDEDHERLRSALSELLPIFRGVLRQAFEEAALNG